MLAVTRDRRLRLIVEPLSPRADGKQLALGVGETQTLAAIVQVENCETSSIEIIADPAYFEVTSGAARIELGSGDLERTVEWRVKATAPGRDLSLQFLATGDGLKQRAMYSVVVHPMPRIDD